MKRYLYLVIGLLLLASGLYVRAQNLAEAHRQADAIVKLDQAGSPTQPAEATLVQYINEHGGTSAAYTLDAAYNRDLAAAKAASLAATTANSQIYADAQKACSGKTDSITQAKCNQDYLAKHLQSAKPVTVPVPAIGGYRRNYSGPMWTTDLSGALLLGGGIAVLVGLFSLIIRRRP